MLALSSTGRVLREYVGSGRGVLGGVAVVDLILLGLARLTAVPAGRTLSVLAESTVFATVVSVASSRTGELQVLGAVVQLVLFGYVLTWALPGLVPDRAGDWPGDVVPRLAFVGGALAASVAVAGTQGESALVGPASASLPLVVGGVAGSVVVAYLWLDDPDPLEAPDGAIYRLVGAAAGMDRESLADPGTEDVDHGPVLAAFNSALVVVAAVGVVGFTVVVAGMVVFGLGLFFPVPELVVLGWAMIGRLGGHSGVGHVTSSDVDLEGDFLGVVRLALTDATHGLPVAVIVGVGLLTGVVPLLGVLGALGQISATAAVDARWFRLAPLVALVVAWVAFGAHSLWFWWRTVRRLPAYFRWRDGDPGASPPVSMPVFATVPGAVTMVMVAFAFLLGGLYLHANPGHEYWPPWLAAVGGATVLPGVSLVAVSLGRTLRLDARDDPQPFRRERILLPAALVLQVLAVTLFLDVNASYDAITEEGLSGLALFTTLGPAESVFVLGGLTALFYLAEPHESDGADSKLGMAVRMVLFLPVVLAGIVVVDPPLIIGVGAGSAVVALLGLGVYGIARGP